jgi:hypothetical protein
VKKYREINLGLRIAVSSWLPFRVEYSPGPNGLALILRFWFLWIAMNVTIS